MSSTCKVRRGQVWFLVNPGAPAEYQGSVQGKNRPWLIVSNDKCNEHSPTFTAVPVTTQAKKPLPVHVHFNDGKLDQIILCEQLYTFPTTLLTTQGSYYKYALSSDLMEQVGDALAIQTGVELKIPNAERFWHSIEQLIKTRVKDALSCAKVEAIDVGKLSTLIDAKVSAIVEQEVKADTPVETPAEAPAEPRAEKPAEPVESVKKSAQTAEQPKSRNKWTIEKKKEFLQDFDKYSTEVMLQRYGMSLKSLYTTRSIFKRQVQNG